MDLRRACIHEAGHFYVAYMYRPARTVSIRVSRQIKMDPDTGKKYISLGEAVTFDFFDTLPRVSVSIRAGGLAAESLVYNESFENLMGDPGVRRSIKTDTDNAKRDLENGRLLSSSSTDAEFVWLWKMGFDDAVCMMRSSQDKLHRMADYCLKNRDRDIPTAELVANCNL